VNAITDAVSGATVVIHHSSVRDRSRPVRDDEGSVQLDGVTLGMRRLSIIDLEGGHQPIHNEDSTVWVVQNGEMCSSTTKSTASSPCRKS